MFYQIRKKDDPNMFVSGTPSHIKYVKKTGRIFKNIGYLRSFLTNVMETRDSYLRYNKSYPYSLADWEIVEFEEIIRGVKSVHEIITPEKLKEMLAK